MLKSNSLAFYSYGHKTGRGNVVGIQPYLTQDEFRKPELFSQRLNIIFENARAKNFIHEDTVILFPEYLGTWLALSFVPENEWSAINSWEKAYEAFSPFCDKIYDVYRTVFSDLAKKNNVTIVAGSALRFVNEQLKNVCDVFSPTGNLLQPSTEKISPTDPEKAFLQAGNPHYSTFQIGDVRYGIVICADGWEQKHVDAFKNRVDCVLCPAFVPHFVAWDSPWGGYSGKAPEEDVDPRDVGRLTEHQAWLKYALPSRAKKAEIPNAMVVFQRSFMWDFGSVGQPLLLSHGHIQEVPNESYTCVVNLEI